MRIRRRRNEDSAHVPNTLLQFTYFQCHFLYLSHWHLLCPMLSKYSSQDFIIDHLSIVYSKHMLTCPSPSQDGKISGAMTFYEPILYPQFLTWYWIHRGYSIFFFKWVNRYLGRQTEVVNLGSTVTQHSKEKESRDNMWCSSAYWSFRWGGLGIQAWKKELWVIRVQEIMRHNLTC